MVLGHLLVLGWALAASAPASHASRSLGVTVLGSLEDSRVAAVEDAVRFWNAELDQAGARIRLGPIRVVDAAIPDALLRRLSRDALGGWGVSVPGEAEEAPGEIVVAFSGADLVSFAVPWTRGRKGFVALRRADVPPLSLPNVAPNVAAHELGHVLGLSHNADASMLMCGRPAPCRPDAYASEVDRFFPLTAYEERELRDIWP